MGLFKKIGNALRKTKEAFAKKLESIFSGGELDDDFYEELTDILISSDVGFESSEKIVENLRIYARKNKIRKAEEVKDALRKIVSEILDDVPKKDISYPLILTIIGVNGVGKTTSIGKLTKFFKNNKKEVMLVAGDTFRAAASDQLSEWGLRNKVKVIKHSEGADAAAVVYDGISSAKAHKTDVLIIDTAGRLHTKTNLMQELGKIDRVITRENPDANRLNLIVIDATTGQNALQQIEAFNEFIKIDGIILTKLDGTAKGGVVITIANDLNIPVYFVGTGESIDDIEEFSSKDFVDNIF